MMANSWGSDGSQLYPPEFSPWTKLQLRWSAPRTPIIGEENRISRVEGNLAYDTSDLVYKIGDGEFGFPIGEYLLIEYMQPNAWTGGLAIYHVDEGQSDYNTEGYPDQIGGGIKWPYNGNHYKIALVPADTNFGLEQGLDSGDSADLYTYGQSLLPGKGATGPFPNTDSYQNGIVKRTGVRVCITSDGSNALDATFLFADGNPDPPWMTRLLETFEETDNDKRISFGSMTKVVENKWCADLKCAMLRTSSASITIAFDTVCWNELKVSFQFLSMGFKNGDQFILEYAYANGLDSNASDGDDDGGDWIRWKTLTKGKKRGDNTFRNRKLKLESATLALPEREAPETTLRTNDSSSKFVLRFRHTSSLKRILIDNVKIEGRF